MAHRIEVAFSVFDTRAQVRKKKLYSLGFKKIKNLFIVDVYTIDKKLTSPQLKKIAQSLSNPLIQKVFIDKPVQLKFNFALEIGYLPGVTDNIANTTAQLIEDLLKNKFKNEERVYSSQLTLIQGSLADREIDEVASSLINPLIQRFHIKSFAEFKKDQGMDKIFPKVKLGKKPNVSQIDLNVSDQKLIEIGKNGIINPDGTSRGPLALDMTYMKTIQAYFKKEARNPTDIELETLAQTWSEHCKHTIFADPIDEVKDGLYKTYIQGATSEIRKKKGRGDFCVSVFKDNSGAIAFDDNYLITHKVETHNTPSALDPFGGAVTGIVGVNRDAIGFGLGAKPIINTYGFCFADPKNQIELYRDSKRRQKMLSALRIMDGVIEGVNYGGNCSGIPTPQGFLFFDHRYRGKPLVFCGTIGLIPRKSAGRFSDQKKAQPGDYVVMIGGRVGIDGIHGATFSSEALETGSPATAVQIGDPITQKKFSDAIVKEARDLGLYNSITDNGAGGLSSSVGEMARESGGCEVQLEKVPLKYTGLDPWQIWISESQERMTLAIPKNKWTKFQNLMIRRGVEATIIGEFTKSGKCIVKYGAKKIMDIDMDFLHNGLPPRPMKTTYKAPQQKTPSIQKKNNLNDIFLKMLSLPNITSFAFISNQYDHDVQGGSVLRPLQGKGQVNADATVSRPVLSSNKGLIISQGICPTYSDIDTYHMAACAIDMAIRNIVAAGGDPDYIALLDNFCWCSANESFRLGQLKRAAQACYDYAVLFQTPYIAGKDSMFNDFKGYDKNGNSIKISIPPTLLISSLGVVPDVSKTISLDAKSQGDLIYVLGQTYDELGGSEYFALFKTIGNTVPTVDAKKNKKLYDAFYAASKKELISSAIAVNRGGLAIALAKIAISGMLGIKVDLKNLPGNASRSDFALFSESQGRIIATVSPKNKKAFETKMTGNKFALIGIVTADKKITIRGKKENIIVNTDIDSALKNYKSTFRNF